MNEKGFTLVEAIIAMAIMGVIAVTFIPLLTVQYVNIQKTGDQSDATYDAVKKVEEGVKKAKDDHPITNPSDPNKIITGDPNIIVTKDADNVEIPSLDIDEKVTTVEVKGEDKKESEERELIVGVPKNNTTP